ncbi:hypothetical protein NTGM5_560055 [Candidatus Nitrotoga sp. M5]|nr:hypothetical protein NTGM5_560055 [Candidatus Nitrotoga sp. M5]
MSIACDEHALKHSVVMPNGGTAGSQWSNWYFFLSLFQLAVPIRSPIVAGKVRTLFISLGLAIVASTNSGYHFVCA